MQATGIEPASNVEETIRAGSPQSPQLCYALMVDVLSVPPKSPPLRPVAVALLAQRPKAPVEFVVVAHFQC